METDLPTMYNSTTTPTQQDQALRMVHCPGKACWGMVEWVAGVSRSTHGQQHPNTLHAIVRNGIVQSHTAWKSMPVSL